MTYAQRLREARETILAAALACGKTRASPRQLAALRRAVRAYEAVMASRPRSTLDSADLALLRRAVRYPLHPRRTGPNRARAERLYQLRLLKRLGGDGFMISTAGRRQIERRTPKPKP